jgi:hypothetical protein
MQEPHVLMAIPSLLANLTSVKFMYSDNKYHGLCAKWLISLQKMGVKSANCNITVYKNCPQ